MANHGKVGEKLQEYRDRKRRSRTVYVLDAKGNMVKTVAQGRYQKPSYLNRAKKRAGK